MVAALLVSAAIIGLDRLVKYYVVSTLAVGETASLIPGVIQLTYARNTGMSFGFMKNFPIIPMILTPLIIAGMIFLLWKKIIRGGVQRWSLICVIAGAIGNFLDRMIYGHVVDMFEPEFVRFAIFNVADCFIVVGGIVFAIAFMLDGETEKKPLEDGGGDSHGD